MAKARTLASLRLNPQAARDGKTWLLLPEGFRSQQDGQTYPLPGRAIEVQQLARIYVPPNKTDAGCIYLRRAVERDREFHRRKQSAALRIEAQLNQLEEVQSKYEAALGQMKMDAVQAVADVKAKASEAIASLHDLFSLGRQGLHGMMKAHLDKDKWQGETISAAAFRQCFRMVSQAVKGLGLPTEERQRARTAILEEVATSLKATQEAVAMAPGPDDDDQEKAN